MLFDYRASVSDLQLFREEPALWLLKHHPDYQYRTESGAAAIRGHATEHALRVACRFGFGEEAALQHARKLFVRNTPNGKDDDDTWEKEFRELPGYVKQGFAGLTAALGTIRKYDTYQMRCEATWHGVRMLGFTDFTFVDDDGVIHGIDIKSTSRLPSEMRDTHREQMAFYRHTTGINFSCLYITPKKHALYTLTDDEYAWGINRLNGMIHSVRTALSLPDWDTIFALFPPRDPTGFRWDEKSRFYADTIWSY